MKKEPIQDTSIRKELVILFFVILSFGEFYYINDITIRHNNSVRNWNKERKILMNSIKNGKLESLAYSDSLKICKTEAQKTLESKIKKFFHKIESDDETHQ